jgi:hypothetical protein
MPKVSSRAGLEPSLPPLQLILFSLPTLTLDTRDEKMPQENYRKMRW